MAAQRGEPITWTFANSISALINIFDENLNPRVLNAHERICIDSFSSMIDLTFGASAIAFLTDNSTTQTILFPVINNGVAYYDSINDAAHTVGAGGSWTAPFHSDGICFPAGVIPIMFFEGDGSGNQMWTAGTGFIINAGGYSNRPPYLQKAS